MKKMYLGNIYSADLEENHITIETDRDIEVYGGRVALLPYKDYENLVNGVVSEDEKALHKQNVSGSSWTIMHKQKPLKNILFKTPEEARNYVKMNNPKRKFLEPFKNVFVCSRYGTRFEIIELNYR